MNLLVVQALSSILSKVDEAQRLPAERESEGLYLVNSVHDAWAKLAARPPGTPPPPFPLLLLSLLVKMCAC